MASAIAAVGMWFIAYLAYEKSNNWFQQKKDEDGYNFVVALMVESDEIFAASIRLYMDICRGDDLAYIKSSVRSYTSKTFILNRKLSACQRWNIEGRLEVTMYFSELKKFYKISSSVLICLEKPDYFSALKKAHIGNLTTCKDDLEKYNILCNRTIEQIFKFPSR